LGRLVPEPEKKSKKVDIEISSFARPTICTAFKQIKLINNARGVIILNGK